MNVMGPDEVASAERRRKRAKARRESWRDGSLPVIDVGKPLRDLTLATESIVLQLERELADKHPSFGLRDDLSMLIRQARETFGLLVFINGDNARDGGAGYKIAYSAVCLPLIRTLIDIYYTIIVLLDAPEKIKHYRLSGFRRKFDALEEDIRRYKDRPTWKSYLEFQRKSLKKGLEAFGLTKAEVRETSVWPTLSRYLRNTSEKTQISETLRILMLSDWEDYSGISHASFAALLDIFPYLDERRFETQAPGRLTEKVDREVSMHMARAAGLLLSIVTEVQSHFRFAGGQIDTRLAAVWIGLKETPVVGELYEQRYKALLEMPVR